jgi:polyisoprenoid-binding protein YceI
MSLQKSLVSLSAALTLAVVALPAHAAPTTYTIDKSHSDVGFQVRHLVSKVRGSFGDFSGTIVMDKDKAENSSVEFVVKAASINTDNEKRDQHLRSPDFFDVEKNPDITFKSTKVTGGANGQYQVAGKLTMRGVTKDVTLPVTFLGEATDPWGNVKAGFETSTDLNRKDYGINWNAALDKGGFLLEDVVNVQISLEVAPKK